MLVILFIIICFFVLNSYLKHTNWFKNKFIYTHQFNRNKVPKLEIVNLGSNPARFAFFYENIYGENWSTGAQDPLMDYELLVNHHQKLKKGAIILLPIVIFSSITPYAIKYKPTYFGIDYYSKFVSLLSKYQLKRLPNIHKVQNTLSYPLLYNWKSIRFLFHDSITDYCLDISEQRMQFSELCNDAETWIKGWKDEFDLIDMEDELSESLQKSQDECLKHFLKTIDFCIEHDYKPILIFPPMSKFLNSQLSKKTKKIYVYSFVDRIRAIREVPFLDYSSEPSFESDDLYLNTLFLNLHGRKKFTQQVLRDLSLIE